ncbi:MAG: ClpXP protease specificity-enhancing factor [Porticoccaceae bacterium]|nr:ClpXP protease specificity-enhancing factor [Porticoccaceae bacterium]
MTSNRPYLVRAIYDWIVDNHCTPHVVVDAHCRGVSVPQQYVSDGQIILNVAPRAVSNFSMDLNSIGFSTRFGGVPTEIYIPIMAVLGVYARENGQGLMFASEEMGDADPIEDEEPSPPPRPKGGKKPSLKIIK